MAQAVWMPIPELLFEPNLLMLQQAKTPQLGPEAPGVIDEVNGKPFMRAT
jgi:hypothetical protein